MQIQGKNKNKLKKHLSFSTSFKNLYFDQIDPQHHETMLHYGRQKNTKIASLLLFQVSK